jgi:hypothetical protein
VSIFTGGGCFEKCGGELVSQRSQDTAIFYSNCSNFRDDVRASIAENLCPQEAVRQTVRRRMIVRFSHSSEEAKPKPCPPCHFRGRGTFAVMGNYSPKVRRGAAREKP